MVSENLCHNDDNSYVTISDIVFIVSLTDSESSLPRSIYDDIYSRQKYTNTSSSSFIMSYYIIKNRQEYDSLIKKLIEYAYFEGKTFMFQIEMHGDEEGLLLSSNELIEWDVFYYHMSILNQISNYNQVINFSTCYSRDFLKSIKLDEPAPFVNCIYSREEVKEEDIKNFYTAFYEKLIDNSSIIDAFNYGNSKSNNFIIIPAKAMFDELINPVFIDLIKSQDDDEFFGNFKYIIDHTDVDKIDELLELKKNMKNQFSG